jgi:hypothetical protein
MTDETKYHPGSCFKVADRDWDTKGTLENRKARFAELNAMATAKGNAWLTSIPGRTEITMECLPDSTLPDDLRKLGYVVTETGEGQRILSGAIVERFYDRSDGVRIAITAGSTLRATSTVRHAGICKVSRFAFVIP